MLNEDMGHEIEAWNERRSSQHTSHFWELSFVFSFCGVLTAHLQGGVRGSDT